LRAQKRIHPNATQKDLRKWFQETYDHTLSSGLISDILSRKYDYLDADSLPTRDAKRQRRENWPELENALFKWIIRVESNTYLCRDYSTKGSVFLGEDLPRARDANFQ
jgi:hypothetical protein